MNCINDTEVVLATATRKIKVLNLDTMTVTRVFEGKLCRYGSRMEIIKDGKEILTLMQGKHGFKTYNIESGRTVSLIHAPSEIRESKHNMFDQYSLVINNINLMACNIGYEGPHLIVVFDYLQNVCVRILRAYSHYSTFLGAYLSQDCSYLPVNTYKSFPHPIIEGKMNSVSCIVVYNIEQGKITHWCLDQDLYNTYAREGELEKMEVDNAILLDDDRLVTSSEDSILRVWNIRTGELIKRLEGHKVLPKLVKNHEKSPYFVTMANFGEENSLRMWDKKTLTCVAMYRLDHKLIL
ncbi:uncharacterized protein LOC132549545 [Ylistrum balloti]|uniref:uncharacterized protein LOC132549545 n=1 Tax=Ylistrum balloti TaxID=509963 RepID=UPI002905977B|nr:uncharacterized protein LOC132549545 [Ylistrum balloti]